MKKKKKTTGNIEKKLIAWREKTNIIEIMRNKTKLKQAEENKFT